MQSKCVKHAAPNDNSPAADVRYTLRVFSQSITNILIITICCFKCLGAVGWVAGRASGLNGGVVAWLSVWSEVYTDLHMTQLMPLPLTVSCFSKIQVGFIFLVPAYPGSP